MKKIKNLLLMCLLALSISSCTRIGPGYVGLKVNLAGGDRGNSQIEPIYGWVGYFPPTTSIVEINTRNQHYITNEPIEVQAKGGTNVIVHPSFNYHVNGSKVDSLYVTWGVTDDQQVEGKLLDATLLTTVREITNGWTIDSLLNYRGNYDLALLQAMDKKLYPYISLFQFTSGVKPDASMAAAIADKAGSIQRAQAAEFKRREISALADLKIIEAIKDSTILVINANAEAEATLVTMKAEAEGIRAKKQEITPVYVEYVRWINAGVDVPRVPATVLGNSSNMLYNLK